MSYIHEQNDSVLSYGDRAASMSNIGGKPKKLIKVSKSKVNPDLLCNFYQRFNMVKRKKSKSVAQKSTSSLSRRHIDKSSKISKISLNSDSSQDSF